MVAAVAAAGQPDACPGCLGKAVEQGRCDSGACTFQASGGTFRVGLGLIPHGFETGNSVLEGRVVQIGNPGFDGVVEALEAQLRLGSAFVQFGDVLAAAFGALLTPVQKRGEDFFEALVIEKPILQMAGNQIVQLLHRDRAAFAAGLALPGFDRAGVIAIAPGLPGPQRHGSAALGAKADSGKEGWATHHAGGGHFRIARAQMRLHGVERGLIDERRDRDRHHLADGFQLLGLGALVELVHACIGAAGQDAVDLPDTPAATVAGEDAVCVQIGDDLLHAERAARSIPFQEQPIDQPDRIGMQRIDLQLLLGF
jgi:hypothetical protein